MARPLRRAHSDFRGLPRSGNNPVQAHTVGQASRMSQRRIIAIRGLEFVGIQLHCDHSLALYVVMFFVDLKLRRSSPVFNHSVTSLLRLGLEKLVAERDLKSIRAWFENQSLDMGVGKLANKLRFALVSNFWSLFSSDRVVRSVVVETMSFGS